MLRRAFCLADETRRAGAVDGPVRAALMYAAHVVREERGEEVSYRLDYGFCSVRLPDYPNVPLWLVVVRGLGAHPPLT